MLYAASVLNIVSRCRLQYYCRFTLQLCELCVSYCSRFEQLAIKVLGNCYQRDKDVTHKLLVRKLHSWQDRTLLSIAGGEKQMDFLGHTACRTKLNNIWRGNITAYTTKFKVRDYVLYLCTVQEETFTQKTFSCIPHKYIKLVRKQMKNKKKIC